MSCFLPSAPLQTKFHISNHVYIFRELGGVDIFH
jgi:hypothetical protein